MENLEEKTLQEVLRHSDENLRILWNKFIEESAKYGEDSYIYNLTNEEDMEFLLDKMSKEELRKLFKLSMNGTKYVQWFSFTLNDNEETIRPKTDINAIIKAYWSDIFPRIMCFPSLYNFNVNLYEDGDGTTFFDDVFFPIVALSLGYEIDTYHGKIRKV